MTPSIADILASVSDLPGENPGYDLEILLCELLDCTPAYLRTWPEKQLSAEQTQRLTRWLDRRREGEPIAHVIGHQPFWSLDLLVSPATLIPRQDTECLIERALQLPLGERIDALDLGTGTGAIALSLAKEKPGWQVTASDFKGEIVALAKKNVLRHALSNVCVIQSHWFGAVSGKRFALIVSNPPYIAQNDEHLSRGDLRYEANTALVSGDGGLADIRLIITQSPRYLEQSGWLVLEHGYDQARVIRSLFVEAGFSSVTSHRDFGGNDRVTLGQYLGNGGKGD